MPSWFILQTRCVIRRIHIDKYVVSLAIVLLTLVTLTQYMVYAYVWDIKQLLTESIIIYLLPQNIRYTSFYRYKLLLCLACRYVKPIYFFNMGYPKILSHTPTQNIWVRCYFFWLEVIITTPQTRGHSWPEVTPDRRLTLTAYHLQT